VPTAEHAEIGCRLMEMGLEVLVEKPMAKSLAEADALLDAAKAISTLAADRPRRTIQPGVLAVEPILNHPLFSSAPAGSVYAAQSRCRRDLRPDDPRPRHLLALVKQPSTEVKAVGIPVLTDKVDIAHAPPGIRGRRGR